MKEKIVIIGPAFPLRGGLASYNERLAREFMKEGYETSIFTFSLQYPQFLFPGKTQFSTDPAPTDLDIKVVINSVNPLNWIKVGRQLKKMAPDRIIVRYWLPFMGPALGTILRIARRNKKTKVVCIADNIIPHEKRPGDKAFTRYFIKPIDAFITMSEKVLGDLKLFDKTKPAQFVPHPLYDNFGEPISKEEARKKINVNTSEKIILFFGFIRKYKGLDILFEAMADERIKQSGIKLLVAGEFYEDETAYKEQIKQLGIEDQLILRTDFIPDSEVRNYLCAADCVVQPYRNATQSGVTPLAYHFEKPMVVTNVGGLPSLVPDKKVGIVTAPDATAIATGILQYFELGENHFLPHLREEKKKYSWHRMVQAITDLSR
jgi:glycosyltransferase involved in cell wall biosynthesis